MCIQIRKPSDKSIAKAMLKIADWYLLDSKFFGNEDAMYKVSDVANELGWTHRWASTTLSGMVEVGLMFRYDVGVGGRVAYAYQPTPKMMKMVSDERAGLREIANA